MLNALVAVDGSTAALRAVEYAVKLADICPDVRFVLLNVQPPADSWELKSHLRQSEIEAMQTSRGGDALEAARRMLNAAKVGYTPVVATGLVAATIVAEATGHGCDIILMGNKGETFVEEIAIGSVAHEVLRISTLPVTFIK